MRKVVLGWVLLVAAAMAYAQPARDNFEYTGKVHSYYGTAHTPQHIQLLTILRQADTAERMAKVAQAAFRFRHDLTVVFTTCGGDRLAFYTPKGSAVVLCLELLDLMTELATNDPWMSNLDKRTFTQVFEGALWGIYFHELAHALVSINRIPITGREEDVADQFAVYFAVNFLEPHGVPVNMPTIWLFQQLAKQRDLSSVDRAAVRRLMADEHSLDEQRIFNVACWALGANPDQGGRTAAEAVGLPASRAERCQAEYGRLRYGMGALFQRFLRIKP